MRAHTQCHLICNDHSVTQTKLTWDSSKEDLSAELVCSVCLLNWKSGFADRIKGPLECVSLAPVCWSIKNPHWAVFILLCVKI